MLNQDFREFIQSLNNNGVRYLVVGGYAVALHGYPRYTKDIDIWVEPSSENAAKIIQALHDFGFGSLDLNINDFTEPNMIIQLGYPPYRIDLIFSPAGVEFDTCFTSRVITEIEGVPVNFIDLENLRINKKSAGRRQDLADLENLE